MIENKSYTCIVCPEGCTVTVDTEGNISGNKCKRGAAYVRSEQTDPRRNIASTVRVTGGTVPVIPVKTASPIPKELIFNCMEEIKRAVQAAPVFAGDTVIGDICGTGIPVIATGTVEKTP